MTLRTLSILAALAVVPMAARAQKRPVRVTDAPPPSDAYGEPRTFGWAGGSLVLALPTGEFKNYVQVGGGLNGFAAFKLTRDGAASLRVDGTMLIYGNETRRVPLGTGALALVSVDVTTSNLIFGLSIGPQLMAPSGTVRPYVNGGIGFSYFATSSSVSGENNSEPFANSTNFGDGTFAVRGGGGLWIRVGHGRTPVWLDLGAQYVRNGRVSYLREGSITFDLAGNPIYSPIESETHLWMVHVGVSAGLLSRPR